MSTRTTLAALVLCVIGSTAWAVQPDLSVDSVRSLVTDTAHQRAPGCAVGVFQDGRKMVVGSGLADLATGREIDGDTLFYAASVSKQFTALAIAQLVVSGRLNLSDDIRKYLPELHKYPHQVTVGMLLHHTSGIRDWIGLMQLAGRDGAATDGKDVALKLLALQQSTNFVPGSKFLYSNGGYLLLAEIVTRISGVPFSQYEREHVLGPLGMANSYFLDGADPHDKTMAHGYVLADHAFVVRDTYPRFGGSGGLVVTMNDLARYYDDIRVHHKVWTDSVRKIMLQPGTFNDGEAVRYQPGGVMGYASGLAVGERRGAFQVEHGGDAEGFKNEFGWFPQKGLAVGVLCNRGDWDPLEKFDAIVEDVAPGLMSGITPEALRGTYRSEELAASYLVEPDGAGLRVTIVPAGARPEVVVLRKAARAGYESGYEGGGIHLTPDTDGMSLMVSTGRTLGIRLTKVGAQR